MNRVLILGRSGSGKTTLTRQLAERIGAEPIFLDQHFWRAGWRRPVSKEHWHGVVASFAERDRWVMDGTYEGSLHLRLPRTDAVILLETPRVTCLRRVIVR